MFLFLSKIVFCTLFFLFMCVFHQKLENIVVEGTGVNMSELTDIPNFTIAEALT